MIFCGNNFEPSQRESLQRSCLAEGFCKKGVFRNFKKFTGLRPATLLKRRLSYRCSPVNFVKFLRTTSVCFCLQRTELVQENPEKVPVTVRELRKLTDRLSPTVMVERKIDSGKDRSLISPPSSVVISSDLSSHAEEQVFKVRQQMGL